MHHDAPSGQVSTFAATLHDAVTAAGSLAVSVFSKVGSAARRFLHVMQTAQMRSVLHRMNDHQLREIGISRAEIDQHADFLLSR